MAAEGRAPALRGAIRFWRLAIVAVAISHAVAGAGEAHLPVPDKTAQAEAMRKVNEVYGSDIAKAAQPENKAALAKTILSTARQTTDAASRFVLLETARDLAARGRDARTALLAFDELVKGFGLAQSEQRQMMTQLINLLPASSDHRVLLDRIDSLLLGCMRRDDYAMSRSWAILAIASARRGGNAGLLERATARSRDVADAKAAHRRATQALAVLEEKPGDAPSNLIAGQFFCYYKSNWEKGIAMLARGTDVTLRRLAERELSPPSDPADQVEIGDGWWRLGTRKRGLAQKSIWTHAACWYRKALPSLNGLARARVEKRLSELEELGGTTAGQPRMEALGSGFHVTALQNGARAFSNRRYTWADVPKALEGWSFTMTAGNSHPTLSVRVSKACTVFVAIGHEPRRSAETEAALAKDGWSCVENLSFQYTAGAGTTMKVWRKRAKPGVLEIPQYGFTGTLLLIPPKGR